MKGLTLLADYAQMADAGPGGIEQAAAADGFTAGVEMELDKLLSRLEETHEDEFNHDKTYKRLLAEAMDGKGHALRLSKVGLYFESLRKGLGAEVLARIHDEPLESFSNADTAHVLCTGTVGFPWAVVSEKKVVIDLGEWNAAANPDQAVKHAAAALSSNPNMRSVLVKGVLLDF